MGFFSKNVSVDNSEINSPPTVTPEVTIQNQLSKEEISLVLDIIRQTTFKGEHIENLYNLVLKLQNQYVSL